MEKYAILILPITLSIIILVAGSIAFYMPLRWEERQRERYPTYRGKISADQVFLLVRGSFLA